MRQAPGKDCGVTGEVSQSFGLVEAEHPFTEVHQPGPSRPQSDAADQNPHSPEPLASQRTRQGNGRRGEERNHDQQEGIHGTVGGGGTNQEAGDARRQGAEQDQPGGNRVLDQQGLPRRDRQEHGEPRRPVVHLPREDAGPQAGRQNEEDQQPVGRFGPASETPAICQQAQQAADAQQSGRKPLLPPLLPE